MPAITRNTHQDADSASKASHTHGTRSRRLAMAALGVVFLSWTVDGPGSRVTTSFGFTGVPQDFVVPAGICRVTIDVEGAAGGDRGGGTGVAGAGGRAIASFHVTPGETLRVRVGGWGGVATGSTPGLGGWNGGGDGGRALGGAGRSAPRAGAGGGGATDIRRGGDELAHRVLVAGGGSGGAGGGVGGSLGTGGGNGGGPVGADGHAVLGRANPATGGSGGTRTAGGAAGAGARDDASPATAGMLGVGGDGAAGAASGGGGGGGGLYGGGGGGSSSSFSGGHGGGGSGFGPPDTDYRPGTGSGFGRATVTYDRTADTCEAAEAPLP